MSHETGASNPQPTVSCAPSAAGELATTERAALLARVEAALAVAEEARRRASFLAEASRTLATSLDYAVTLDRVARLALPDFADWCIVDLVDDDGTPSRVAVSHALPEKAELARELHEHYPLDPRWPEGIIRVLRSGRGELWDVVPDSLLVAIGRDPRHLELLRTLGVTSAVCVPMVARGRLLGGVTLMYGDSARRYGPTDLPFAEDLARRAAAAVDNARLYRAAQNAVRAREEFLSIASHELRTPLTSLQLAVQGLGHLARTGTPAPANLHQVAMRQCARLTQLVDRLLDVSRIQAGRLALDLETVDLAAVLREVAAGLADEAARCGCELKVSAPGPVAGRWDRSRVQQIVENLLSNALKYGAGQPVEASAATVSGRARLRVADRGIGIEPQHQARIFERFERAVSPQHYSGLGLGLYIVRRTAEAMGGQVGVSSRPGQGAVFTVDLPAEGPPGDPGAAI